MSEEEMPEEEEVGSEEGSSEGEMGMEPEVEAPPAAAGPPAGGAASGAEPMIQDILKAIADAITAQTGVQVGVEGSAEASPGGEEMGMEPGAEMGMEPGGEEMGMEPGAEEEEEMPPMQESVAKFRNTVQQMVREAIKNSVGLKEAAIGSIGKEAPDAMSTPKATKQNTSAQGTVKDPDKSKVKVAGVEKPTSIGSAGYPHKLKALEEKIAKSIYTKILEELKKKKVSESQNEVRTGSNVSVTMTQKEAHMIRAMLLSDIEDDEDWAQSKNYEIAQKFDRALETARAAYNSSLEELKKK